MWRKDSAAKNVQIPKELIPNTENLNKLKRWGMKHYRVNRQRIQELMGTATITTEPELEPRVEKLQEQLRRYKELHQVINMTPTQYRCIQDGMCLIFKTTFYWLSF